MDIQGKTVLITGANRGIGAALVRAFLKHGAGKVYAAARNPGQLPDFADAVSSRWRSTSPNRHK